VDGFEEEGADPALVALLRKALGEREEMEIRWTRT
jgi:processive 1,2-diacylglycerol beta-glucosyltransferase